MDLLASLPAFLAAVLLIALTPGPGMALVIRRSAVGGFRAGAPVVLGLEAAVYAWALLAGAGLAALVAASEVAYAVLRVVGAAVLLAMGLLAWRSAWRHRSVGDARSFSAGVPPCRGGRPTGLPPGDGGAPATTRRDEGAPATTRRDEGAPATTRRDEGAPATRTGARAQELPLAARPWRGFAVGALTNLANPKLAVFMIAFYPQFVPADRPLLATTAALAALQVAIETVLYLGLAAGVGRARAWFLRGSVRRRFDVLSGSVLVALGARVAVEPG